jgi:tRNA(Arg) A34 adenosine deaminase TadA
VTDPQHSTIAEIAVAKIAQELISKRNHVLYPVEDLDVAFLVHHPQHAEHSKDISAAALYFALHSRSDRAPTSAVARLIQGIYATEPDQSRVIVRNRIFTTAPLTTMCRGMIAVAAKRATDQIFKDFVSAEKKDSALPLKKTEYHQIDLSQSVNGLSTSLNYGAEASQIDIAKNLCHDQTDEKYWINLALELIRPTQILRQQENETRLFLYNRPVAAVLVSREGKLLDRALNMNATNKTLHAELNLVQSFYRKFGREFGSKLPAGSKLFTTLKPCKMCAGMLFDAAEDMRSFEVIYAEDDPGTNARNTALEKFQRKL